MWKYRKIRRKLAWTLLVVSALCAAGFFIVDFNLRPIVLTMAQAKVEAIAVKAVNDAVREVMMDKLKYTDLVNIIQDGNGQVSMIQANTIRMNDLSAQIASFAQDKIIKVGSQGIGIPLGSIIGGEIFAGRGPVITIKIIPVGSITSEFVSEFQTAGINQTRHRIYLKATSNIRIIIPRANSSVQVVSQVPISESIIVGSVPHSYVNVDDPNQVPLVRDPQTGE